MEMLVRMARRVSGSGEMSTLAHTATLAQPGVSSWLGQPRGVDEMLPLVLPLHSCEPMSSTCLRPGQGVWGRASWHRHQADSRGERVRNV